MTIPVNKEFLVWKGARDQNALTFQLTIKWIWWARYFMSTSALKMSWACWSMGSLKSARLRRATLFKLSRWRGTEQRLSKHALRSPDSNLREDENESALISNVLQYWNLHCPAYNSAVNTKMYIQYLYVSTECNNIKSCRDSLENQSQIVCPEAYSQP